MAAACRAEYVWGVHVATFAAKAELTEGQIESLMLADAYRTASYLVNGLRLPLESNARRFADLVCAAVQ
jgi:hypothetical protein